MAQTKAAQLSAAALEHASALAGRADLQLYDISDDDFPAPRRAALDELYEAADEAGVLAADAKLAKRLRSGEFDQDSARARASAPQTAGGA